MLEEDHISCPYCGEPLTVLIDPSEAGQEYIEDCQICCRPIIMQVNAMGTAVEPRTETD
jgi:cysteine-rich CPXCG protein